MSSSKSVVRAQILMAVTLQAAGTCVAAVEAATIVQTVQDVVISKTVAVVATTAALDAEAPQPLEAVPDQRKLRRLAQSPPLISFDLDTNFADSYFLSSRLRSCSMQYILRPLFSIFSG